MLILSVSFFLTVALPKGFLINRSFETGMDPAKRWSFLLEARPSKAGPLSAAIFRTSVASGSPLRGSAALASRVAEESARRSRPTRRKNTKSGSAWPATRPHRPAVKSVAVSFGDDRRVFTFDTTGHSSGEMGWDSRSWIFTATGETTTLVISQSQG